MKNCKSLSAALVFMFAAQAAFSHGPGQIAEVPSEIVAFENLAGINGPRRYINITVEEGYAATRAGLLAFLNGDEDMPIKMIHGTPYYISLVTGIVPQQLRDDSALELKGNLINRSTNTALDDMVWSVYEFKSAHGSEFFAVEYHKSESKP